MKQHTQERAEIILYFDKIKILLSSLTDANGILISPLALFLDLILIIVPKCGEPSLNFLFSGVMAVVSNLFLVFLFIG